MVNVRGRPLWFWLPWLTTISACQTSSPFPDIALRSKTTALPMPSAQGSTAPASLWGMRTLSFTDADRDLDTSFLEETFLFGGVLDLCRGGVLDLDVTRMFLALERDLSIDCVPAPGLRGAGRLAGDLDAGCLLGGERLCESDPRKGAEAFLGGECLGAGSLLLAPSFVDDPRC